MKFQVRECRLRNRARLQHSNAQAPAQNRPRLSRDSSSYSVRARPNYNLGREHSQPIRVIRRKSDLEVCVICRSIYPVGLGKRMRSPIQNQFAGRFVSCQVEHIFGYLGHVDICWSINCHSEVDIVGVIDCNPVACVRMQGKSEGLRPAESRAAPVGEGRMRRYVRLLRRDVFSFVVDLAATVGLDHRLVSIVHCHHQVDPGIVDISHSGRA